MIKLAQIPSEFLRPEALLKDESKITLKFITDQNFNSIKLLKTKKKLLHVTFTDASRGTTCFSNLELVESSSSRYCPTNYQLKPSN